MSKSVLTCLLATTATVWLAVAIAQTIAPNNMLTAAGFVAKYPDTPEKQEIFNSLPPNRLVKRGRNGKIYYVYADLGGCGCAYVGSPNAYANYRNGGFRDRDNNDRVVSEMMRDMDQDDAPEQPGSPNGLDYITYLAAPISDAGFRWFFAQPALVPVA